MYDDYLLSILILTSMIVHQPVLLIYIGTQLIDNHVDIFSQYQMVTGAMTINLYTSLLL